MSSGYEALRESAAWVDLSGRGKIKATGEDRARLLHALSTNHVQQLTPGLGCYAFFLNAQGKIQADANILCFADHFLIDTEPETHEKLFALIDGYIIADDVTLENVSGKLVTIGVEGPKAGDVLSSLGATLPETPYGFAAWGERILARLNASGGEGYWIFCAAADREALVKELEAAGVVAASADDVRVVRLENGKPRYGDDIFDTNIPQETGQIHALHFSKGCYLGQEIVERVRSQGHINRMLSRLRIEGAKAPEAGTKISSGPKDAGKITSAAYSPAFGEVVALGYLWTAFARSGVQLEVGDDKLKAVASSST
jgi:aminomethyltransferase